MDFQKLQKSYNYISYRYISSNYINIPMLKLPYFRANASYLKATKNKIVSIHRLLTMLFFYLFLWDVTAFCSDCHNIVYVTTNRQIRDTLFRLNKL